MKSKKRKKHICLISILVVIIAVGIGGYFFLKSDNKVHLVREKKLKVYDINSNKRPIAIMIDNNVGNNSHVGLQDAYLTYEMIVEGGLTRLMTIYKDTNTKVIGPVRSSRHYFLDYAKESDAIYAHFGYSTYAEKDIKALAVNNINGLYDDGYYRNHNIAAPHNVFTSIEELYSVANSKNYATSSNTYELLNYDTKEANLASMEDAVTANNISMSYSYNQKRSYIYDTTNKNYLRYMNNNPHTDRDSNKQYHYKNIIIMKINNYQLDKEGRQDLDTVGEGDGYYISNGYAIPITFKKNSRTSKTKYYYNNEELLVNDGNTFIQIVPINSDIVID